MTSFYTYTSLTNPGHADIEDITEALCAIGIHPDRIAVHPQTVNVVDVTPREEAQIGMADPVMTSGNNLLRTGHN